MIVGVLWSCKWLAIILLVSEKPHFASRIEDPCRPGLWNGIGVGMHFVDIFRLEETSTFLCHPHFCLSRKTFLIPSRRSLRNAALCHMQQKSIQKSLGACTFCCSLCPGFR